MTSKKIKILRFDNGGEYTSKELVSFYMKSIINLLLRGS